MKNLDYNYLCTVIGNLSGIPIRLYNGNKQVFYHSLTNLPKDPITICMEEIFNIHANVGYLITSYFNYYGVINSSAYKIVIGPSRQVAMNEHDIRELGFKCDVSPNEMNDFIFAMNGIVPMPFESIIQILCTMNYIMNGEKLNVGDITIYDTEQAYLKEKIEYEQTNNNYSADINFSYSTQSLHSTLTIEQTIMNFVRKGDTIGLKKWIHSAPAVRAGVLATDQLRQLKNTFIVTATLASRAAIKGGMNANDSLSLSDSYVQKCELMNSMERLINLQFHMILDYTERVEKLRLGKTPSKLLIDIANYIQHHICETITTEQIAKELFISRSHLSTKFKAETGENLTNFIQKEKMEEAKRLLHYTDKSLVSISAYLCFSSQSHFSRVFKKYTKQTPNEYRKIYTP